MADTVPGDISSIETISIGGIRTGEIDTSGDHDFYRVTLTAGQTYVFAINAGFGGPIDDTILTLRDAAGVQLATNDDRSFVGGGYVGSSLYSAITFTATSSGTFFLDASGFGTSTGTFTLSATTVPTADIANSTATTATLAIGGTIGSNLTASDSDWVAVTLVAGQTYRFTTDPGASGVVADTTLTLRNAAGTQVGFNDDINFANDDFYSSITFTATTSGTYYLDVRGFDATQTGNYLLTAVEVAPLPVFTNDEIADQLVNGYWESNGQTARGFDVAPGGTITIDISGLTAEGAFLAVQAFNLWSDVTGITFAQQVGGAQITLDDADSGAYATSVVSAGVTQSSTVNVGLDWLAAYGTTFNTYSFQTYIHEIGHALGLGHAGDYNGSASYAVDALYQNDSWATTIMSYFDQVDNSYFANLGFTYNFVLTPMMADLVAMSLIYGSSTTTRVGNTTYGFGNNSGRAVFDAVANPNAAYTIYDSGGVDTLNYSGYTQNQLISLIEETFSNVGAGVGNVSIGRGVVIENATGGSGNDQIFGNAANNYLDGRGGTDTMAGGGGNDIYIVDNVGDVVDETSGTGTDEVRATVNFTIAAGVENLRLQGTATVGTGNNGANSLFAGAGATTLNGLGGADFLYGRGNADTLNGGAGDDTLFGGNNNDILNGGDDNDTLRGDIGSDTLNGDAGNDTLYGFDGIDTLRGGSGDDVLRGELQNDFLYGDAGVDQLFGGDGADALYGGTERDVLNGGAGNDSFYFDDGDFAGLTNATADRIQDFTQGSDRIRLNLVDAIAGGADNAFTFIGTAAFSSVAGQLRYTQAGGVTLILGDTDGNGAADIAIALTGTVNLVAGDFVL